MRHSLFCKLLELADPHFSIFENSPDFQPPSNSFDIVGECADTNVGAMLDFGALRRNSGKPSNIDDSVRWLCWVHSAVDAQRMDCDSDRKSTRLNSSHRCISYAVFCL